MLMGWFHASNQLNMESKLLAVATCGDISDISIQWVQSSEFHSQPVMMNIHATGLSTCMADMQGTNP